MKFLQSCGHRVEMVENGALAIEAYKTKSYDVILMDVVSIPSVRWRFELTDFSVHAGHVGYRSNR